MKHKVEPWHCNPEKVHVYRDELWKTEINSSFSAVIHDLTVDQVKEIIGLLKWEDDVAPSCSQLAEKCREISRNLAAVPVTKTQIGNLGFPVNGLTPVQVAYLQFLAEEHRRLCAEYAQNPFIDPIKFDSDEVWLQLAEWFEENTDYVRDE